MVVRNLSLPLKAGEEGGKIQAQVQEFSRDRIVSIKTRSVSPSKIKGGGVFRIGSFHNTFTRN